MPWKITPEGVVKGVWWDLKEIGKRARTPKPYANLHGKNKTIKTKKEGKKKLLFYLPTRGAYDSGLYGDSGGSFHWRACTYICVLY